MLIVGGSLLHYDHLCWPLLLEDLRKSAQWIPIRLVTGVDLAQSFVRVLAFAAKMTELSEELMGQRLMPGSLPLEQIGLRRAEP